MNIAYLKEMLIQIELHSIEGIRYCFENGISPNDLYNGKPLIYELISEYTRSKRFKDCVKLFVEYGLEFENKPLLSALLNDSTSLEQLIRDNPEIVSERYSLLSAYTPLEEVSLLHICAEFDHVDCAKVLVNHHANINSTAGVDEFGFGGQTPIFHTVNQNGNQSERMMEYLLSQGVNLNVTVKGIIWGRGYEWETFIPSVNPISYAMMGLLPQMHRDEIVISNIVSRLIRHQYNIFYKPENIPNSYLRK